MNSVCPYSKIPLSSENSITFPCGHRYSSDLFQEISILYFECCVGGCSGEKKELENEQPEKETEKQEWEFNFEVGSDLIEEESPKKDLNFEFDDIYSAEKQEFIRRNLLEVDLSSSFFCSTPPREDFQEKKSEQESAIVITEPEEMVDLELDWSFDFGIDTFDSENREKKKRKVLKKDKEESLMNDIHVPKISWNPQIARYPSFIVNTFEPRDSNLYFNRSNEITTTSSPIKYHFHTFSKRNPHLQYTNRFKIAIPQTTKKVTPCAKKQPHRCMYCGIVRKGNTKMVTEKVMVDGEYMEFNTFICLSEKCLNKVI